MIAMISSDVWRVVAWTWILLGTGYIVWTGVFLMRHWRDPDDPNYCNVCGERLDPEPDGGEWYVGEDKLVEFPPTPSRLVATDDPTLTSADDFTLASMEMQFIFDQDESA